MATGGYDERTSELPAEVWELTRRWAIGDDCLRDDALTAATTEELQLLLDTVIANYQAIEAIVDREDTDLLWLLEAAADARAELTERSGRARKSSPDPHVR